ncbi:MAG: hypothetical protein IH594_12765, partial [Bacteroidales bacterium]|nr:hypothetical protein [Bacteroidales bacterium]
YINEPSNSPYDPLERVAKLAGIFPRRAEVLRNAGKKAGINVWPSFGTGSEHEKSPLRPGIPFQPAVGMNGKEDPGIVCPVSPGFLEYTYEKYSILAAAGPDFIWLDDDIRFTDLFGEPFPCFCDNCLSGFLEGAYTSRELLVSKLNDPQLTELRRHWSAYAADRLADYCGEARRAVDAVDPSIDCGFMTVGPTHTTYAGDFIEKCTHVLRSKRVRPGHGFYQDERPVDMLGKAMEVGRQTVRYPGHATDIQYEEESWPDPLLDKAINSRINEIWLALAAGCNGVALNHLPFSFLPGDPDMLKQYNLEVDEFHRQRPAWEQYVQFSKGLPWQGFRPADNIFLMAGRDCSKNGWFQEGGPDYAIDRPQQTGQMGIPLTTDPDKACAVLFAGKIIETLSEQELMEIFSKGVIMDHEALKVLHTRGLGHLAGVRPGKCVKFARERATTHIFNGPFAAYERFGISEPSCMLEPIPGVAIEELATLVDAYDKEYGPCMTAFLNGIGGKVVVSAYSAWKFLGHPYKLWQLRSIAEWMGSPLVLRWQDPMVVSRIAPFIRSDGKRAAMLFMNASLDKSQPFDAILRGSMTRAFMLLPDGSRQELESEKEGELLAIGVKGIDPWSNAVIFAE